MSSLGARYYATYLSEKTPHSKHKSLIMSVFPKTEWHHRRPQAANQKTLELDTASLKAENKGGLKNGAFIWDCWPAPLLSPKAAKETLDTWSYLL